MRTLRLATLLFSMLIAGNVSAQDLSGHCGAGWPLGPKPTVDAQDDDFDGVLSTAWVVTEGAAGTVDLLRTTASPTEVYDLTTMPGVLLLQSGPNKYNNASPDQVTMYQEFTLGDHQSVVYAVAVGAGARENGYNIGIWLSNSTTSPYAAPLYTPYVNVQVDAEFTQGYRMNSTANNLHLPQTGKDQSSNPAAVVLQKIVRSGLTYSMYWSNNWGLTWSHFGTKTQTSPLTKMWIASQNFAQQDAIFNIPVHAILWICIGTDNYNPW